MKTNQKELLQIAFFCFLSGPFFKTLFTLYGIVLYVIMGFHDYHIAIDGSLLGCIPNNWMKVVTTFGILFYFLFMTVFAFLLVKKGEKLSDKLIIIVGSLFMYPIINASIRFIYFNFKDPLFHFKSKHQFEKIRVSLFENLHNLRVFNFVESVLFVIISLIISYVIVKKYWDKNLRILFITVGLFAVIMGNLMVVLFGKFYIEFIK
jgi:hypothetical protein